MPVKQQYPVVRIDFDDHALCMGNEPEVIPCSVIGVLIGENKSFYKVVCWFSNRSPLSDQNDGYAIKKHKGLKLTRIGSVRF
jgi:hypothetical protein